MGGVGSSIRWGGKFLQLHSVDNIDDSEFQMVALSDYCVCNIDCDVLCEYIVSTHSIHHVTNMVLINLIHVHASLLNVCDVSTAYNQNQITVYLVCYSEL